MAEQLDMSDPETLELLLRKSHVLVGGDNDFQKRARLLQALWRESKGLPIGNNYGEPVGSLISMPEAKDELSNYLSDNIREVFSREVLHPTPGVCKLFARPRIFNDLLSSQPLTFNLFGELKHDLDFGTRVLRRVWPDRIAEVTSIEFEHAPRRSDPKFAGAPSSFDVFLTHRTPSGKNGFIGFEVRYHEDLTEAPLLHWPRSNEIAGAMGVFVHERLPRLQRMPFQQLFRAHLLAGILLTRGDFEMGLFSLVYPGANFTCERVVKGYRECLTSEESFEGRTLEDLASAIRAETDAPWIHEFYARYLDFPRVEALLQQGASAQPSP